MKSLLSICIPTMNRPEFLLQAVNSILADNACLNQIEICISNNCSESDYSEVERQIESNSNICKIDYVRHISRLSLDDNHHYVTKMASSDYIFYLGDDDYFLPKGLSRIVELISSEEPDLAILNGIIVDDDNQQLRKHFDLPPRVYRDMSKIFRDLRDKGAFGSVLVKTRLLDETYFQAMHGSSHAYGCFWISLLWQNANNIPIKVMIPSFEGVALRASEKNYNHIAVYFRDILHSITVFRKYAPPGEAQLLLDASEARYYRRISSLRFLVSLSAAGVDLSEIKTYHTPYYRKLRIKILLSKFIVSVRLYAGARFFVRLFRDAVPV